ncbi:MAG: phosphate acyltransferase, partial [Chlamydiota bacterium]
KGIDFLCTDLQQDLHYAQYPGAILIGVDGLIIKCHGYSSTGAFKNGIKGAIQFCQNEMLQSIKDSLPIL